ncbi:uncharacterized protein [Chironomus tepperi]|uniref:uncharacterized protein n=1 Tax=Chironomus tepperi TaxID=113505 RepID=UPI00391FC3DE
MRLIVIFCVILFKFQDYFCDDGFVTVWAPKAVFPGGDYSLYYQPTGLKPTESKYKASFQFRKKNATVDLKAGKGGQITFPKKLSSGSRKDFNLTMTLYRKVTKSGIPVEQCTTRTFKVDAEKRNFYTFVQMDKPIYKPGDEVKFRVLVIDRNLKPYHMNNIHINITDPLDRPMKELKDLDDSFLGVFSSRFKISSKTSLGDWKIRVIVDKMHQFEYAKVFPVQEYVMPQFDISMSIEAKHMLVTKDLKLSFHAQYIFGESVRGDAVLTILDPKSGKEYLKKQFQNIQGVQKLSYSIKNELKVTTTSILPLEAFVTFSEPESSYSVNRSIQFFIHGSSKSKIEPLHDTHFVAGLPFNIKVAVFAWNGDVLESNDIVDIKFTYVLENNEKKIFPGSVGIVDGYATHFSIAPKNAVALNIQVKFQDISYNKKIEKKEAGIGQNGMTVFYLPKKPKLGDEVEVTVESVTKLGKIVVIIMSRYGISETKHFDCELKMNCKFPVKITKDIIPQSNIRVYYVQETRTIIYGETVLVTDEIGDNFLNVALPSTTVKTGDQIKMKFETKYNSKIYLLAFDKALLSLRTGNDIQKSDIVNSVADYQNGSIVFYTNLKAWRTCTAEEIKRVQSGIFNTTSHTGDTLYAEDSDDDDDLNDLNEDEEASEVIVDPVEDGLLRDNFPETWIFEELDFGDDDEALEKAFKVPDTITSYVISAFSVNEESGVAIAPTKELKVKNEFFMKLILPYSIKFGEIFQLDILVYNYLASKQSIDVKVDLYNQELKEFEFIEFDGDTITSSSVKKSSKTVTVPHSNLKKVSFYIRPKASNNQGQGYPRAMKLFVHGKTKDKNGKTYTDLVKKVLRVEPAGIKVYEIVNINYELDGTREHRHQFTLGSVDNLEENDLDYPNVSIAVAGDYLTDTINMNSRFEFYPTDGLEQKTSKLKGNVEYFRYMMSTSNRPATTSFSDYYQSLLKQQTGRWRLGAPSGYRAYFAEAIASAMEMGALPVNKRIIRKELDALKNQQTEDGHFKDFGSFPEFLDTDREETAQYFQTSFVLVSFLKFKGFITKSYEDVINKGFEYLNNPRNRLHTDNEGLSIAAYVYALNGHHDQAQNLLNEIEKDKFQVNDNQRCLKISSSHKKCNIRHTSYAAIAYFTMNKIQSAKPLINWLLEFHNLNKYYSNTHSYAIATEAIAKLASSRRSHGTNFTVVFKNEANFNQVVNIEQKNIAQPVTVDFPEYSLTADMTISGYGFCSITTIIEKTVTIGKTTPDFQVTVKTSSKRLSSNEKTIKVCAVYNPHGDISMATLYEVIYDVEMPSGYIYLNIVDFEVRAHDIKMVQQRQKASRVIIYFNEFNQLKDYCVEIQVKKAFEVKNAKDSGVRVYNFNDKLYRDISTSKEMKFLLSLFFSLIAWNFVIVECDELVGVLVPKVTHEGQPYNTLIKVFDLEDPAEVAVQFHTLNTTYSLVNEGTKAFQYDISKFGSRKSVNLTTTLYREKKIHGNAVKQCNTQVRSIKVEYPRFYIFIQFNKPIYKPGDVVQFRIIVVDKQLIPYQMNNINITITDPYDRPMYEFGDLEDMNLGTYISTFNLSDHTLLGDWKMTVIVEKQTKYQASKIFPVQKYVLPLFALKVDTSSKHYLKNHKLIISFGAKYSFGEYVAGNAVLTIYDTSDNAVCFTRNYPGITGIHTVTLNIREDLKVYLASVMNFKATVTFTEPETDTEVIKSTLFSVHDSEAMSIKTVHSNTYTPGLPFNLKVFAKKWNGDKFISEEPVSVKITYSHKGGKRTSMNLNPKLDDGVANSEVIVPLDVETFDIECKFISSKTYRKRLTMAKVEQTRNSMILEYKPKKPVYGEDVEIFASSAYRMEQVLVSIVTKFGVLKNKVVSCNDNTACSFTLSITAEMMPSFTVEVFHIRDKNINEHGSVSIETESLGTNYLTMNMSSTVSNVKKYVTMTFGTEEESTIYLLAIDKSLKFLRDGNDVSKDDIVKELSAYTGQSEVILDDMTSWHDCTADEIKRVESGRVKIEEQTSDTFVSSDDDENTDENVEIDDDDDDGDGSEPTIEHETTEDDLMRQEFPETWIFESIEVEDTKTTKTYKVPDTITSWHITAFSVNQGSGLAVIEPQELAVKNEFFIKVSLPYSIRYKEVLRVDVLVFNYVDGNKPLDVKVTLKNEHSKQFQFVEYEKKGQVCSPKYKNLAQVVQNVKVDGMGMKKVSFYIRSNPNDENDRSNKVKSKKVIAIATATDSSGKSYKDGLQKRLRIEPVGIRRFRTDVRTFVVKGERKNDEIANSTNVNSNYCIVSGDFLTDIINLNSGFEIYSGDCLEQRTSKLKGNVQVYKYFQTKKKAVNKDYFRQQYQAVWDARGKRYNYEDKTGYISYFIDAVVPAMELQLINADIPTIEKELDKLKKQQTDDGNFENFGNFPSFSDDTKRKDTRTYFQTAYVLISFLKAKKFVTNSYQDVIDKAFKYLDSKSIRNLVDIEGKSIAAYAYALNKEDGAAIDTAKDFLDGIEEVMIDYGGNKRCFKIERSSSNCDMRHTAYAAMAYLTLDDIGKAMPLIYWMIKEYNFYMYQGYTYNTAILSEPIADAAVALGVDFTNFEVTLKSDNKPLKSLKFDKRNNNYEEIPFIPNTLSLDVTVDGTGFCSVTRVDEIIITEATMIDLFTVTVTPSTSNTQNEKIVTVCASYNSTDQEKDSILNVVYEVEFPSGYIYGGIVDEKKQRQDIKQVEERKSKTIAIIYYNDFKDRKTYCVDVKAMKVHDVKNALDAGVKVYDFDDKKNVAIEFYGFKSSVTC